MFGLGKKLFGAKKAMKKVENRDLMQAIVGGCLLVAAANGEITRDESAQIDKQIRANKNLEHFGAEISKTVTLYTEQLEAGFRLGRMNILREIQDIANNPMDAEEVFTNMLVVAESDGDVYEAELKVLSEVARLIGINPKDYGLAA